jgi:hypothetical protein
VDNATLASGISIRKGHAMATGTAYEAKTHLPRLLREVERAASAS